MPSEYPEEFKKRVIERYKRGETINTLSRELHSAQSTICHWRKRYCSIETPKYTYTPKAFDVILRRLQKLENEMEIIRLSEFLSEVPLQKRLIPRNRASNGAWYSTSSYTMRCGPIKR